MTLPTVTERACRTCGATKPLTEYGRHARYEDGMNTECRLCAAARQRAYYTRPYVKATRAARKYASPLSATTAQRLEAGLDKEQVGAGCWEWTRAKNKEGYGVIYTGGPLAQDHTHRVAWELAGNPMPVWPMVVDHRCYNRACCNPAHLQVVSQKDNCTVLARDEPHRYWDYTPADMNRRRKRAA